MATFKVYCPDEESEADASLFESVDAADAAEDWARASDENGAFCEGYPSGLEVIVIHEDGTRTTCRIDTDWSPTFFAYEPIA